MELPLPLLEKLENQYNTLQSSERGGINAPDSDSCMRVRQDHRVWVRSEKAAIGPKLPHGIVILLLLCGSLRVEKALLRCLGSVPRLGRRFLVTNTEINKWSIYLLLGVPLCLSGRYSTSRFNVSKLWWARLLKLGVIPNLVVPGDTLHWLRVVVRDRPLREGNGRGLHHRRKYFLSRNWSNIKREFQRNRTDGCEVDEAREELD